MVLQVPQYVFFARLGNVNEKEIRGAKDSRVGENPTVKVQKSPMQASASSQCADVVGECAIYESSPVMSGEAQEITLAEVEHPYMVSDRIVFRSRIPKVSRQ